MPEGSDRSGKKTGKKQIKKKLSGIQNAKSSNKKLATAYHIYIREQIPRIKQEFPDINPKELLPTACDKWRTLTLEEKQQYADRAKEENARKASAVSDIRREDGETERQIPIFTQAFIIHNKEREKEFRQLQKAASEVQQQAALLSAHTDSLKTAINRLENEVSSQRSRCQQASMNLSSTRKTVMDSLVSISGRVTEEGPASADVFKSFSTSDLLKNLQTMLSTSVNEMDKEQKLHVKESLVGILDHLSSMHSDSSQTSISHKSF